MEYNESKVYTAVTADKLKVGSKVIVANYLELLIAEVKSNAHPTYVRELSGVMGTSSTNRFKVGNETYNLAYLVSEPEEKKLKWTDLKIGDTIKKGTISQMVMGIDTGDTTCHILAGRRWMNDENLKDWEKVELW